MRCALLMAACTLTVTLKVPSALRAVTNPMLPVSSPRVIFTASPTSERCAVGVPSLSESSLPPPLPPLSLLPSSASLPSPARPRGGGLRPEADAAVAGVTAALRAAGRRAAVVPTAAVPAKPNTPSPICPPPPPPPSPPPSATSKSGACFRISNSWPSGPIAVTHVQPAPLPVTTPTTPPFTRPSLTRTRMPRRASAGTLDSVVPGGYAPPRPARAVAGDVDGGAGEAAISASASPASAPASPAPFSAPSAGDRGAGDGGLEVAADRDTGRPSGPISVQAVDFTRTTFTPPSPSRRTRTHCVKPPPGPPGAPCTSSTVPVTTSPAAVCTEGGGGMLT